VAGKVEMGLRVAWDVPNIFEYFVNTHAELRLARDRLVGARHEFTQEEKIELGRMFDRLLNDDREDHTRKVEHALAPVCAEFKANPCRNEHEVMNLACLVRARPAGRVFRRRVRGGQAVRQQFLLRLQRTLGAAQLRRTRSGAVMLLVDDILCLPSSPVFSGFSGKSTRSPTRNWTAKARRSTNS
jgi:hypothetical protein